MINKKSVKIIKKKIYGSELVNKFKLVIKFFSHFVLKS